MAYTVEDGQKIYIPSKLDNSENIDDGDVVVMESAGVGVLNENEGEGKTGLININTANETKLQELPGIGSLTASKIVNYRNENRKI